MTHLFPRSPVRPWNPRYQSLHCLNLKPDDSLLRREEEIQMFDENVKHSVCSIAFRLNYNEQVHQVTKSHHEAKILFGLYFKL